MAEENTQKPEETPEEKPAGSELSFKTADELSTFLMDLQGQISNMQQTIDKLSPVTEESEEKPEETPEEETPAEEVNEIDQLLQTD